MEPHPRRSGGRGCFCFGGEVIAFLRCIRERRLCLLPFHLVEFLPNLAEEVHLRRVRFAAAPSSGSLFESTHPLRDVLKRHEHLPRPYRGARGGGSCVRTGVDRTWNVRRCIRKGNPSVPPIGEHTVKAHASSLVSSEDARRRLDSVGRRTSPAHLRTPKRR